MLFKVPDFIKYNVYCSKIAKEVHDKKLMIHFFHESLKSITQSWYMY
jgi:high-affinity nickel permease